MRADLQNNGEGALALDEKRAKIIGRPKLSQEQLVDARSEENLL
jgi:hypothetical protein